jgi:predicted MFS family arabinose efflux permease
MLGSILQIYQKSFAGLSKEVWLISFVMLVNRAGTMVLPFLTLYLTGTLNFTLIQAGIATGFYGVGSLVGSYLGGWLTDKIGFYKVVFWSLILSGVGFWAIILVKSFYAFCMVILIVSIIADSVRPATMTGIGAYTNSETQTRGISLIRMAFNLGISIGPALGGLIAGIFGFHWMFIIEGATCIAAGFIFLWLLDEKKAVKEIEADFTDTGYHSAYRDYTFLLFLFCCLVNIVAFMQILSTVPLYFREVYSLSEAQIGLFFTVNGLLIFIFEMPIVYIIERKFRLMGPIMIGAFMMALAHFAFPVFPGAMWAIIIYTFMITFGEIINFPFCTSLSLKRAPEKLTGQYMGLVSMMFALTFIIAPVIGTYLVDEFGFTTLWLVMGFLGMASIIGFSLMRNRMESRREIT